MKKNVDICDVCNNIISDNKCEICDKDLCKICRVDTKISVLKGGVIWHMVTCKSCNFIISKSKLKHLFDEDINKPLRAKLMKILKNGVMLKTLEEDDERGKEVEEEPDYANLLAITNSIKSNKLLTAKTKSNPWSYFSRKMKGGIKK